MEQHVPHPSSLRGAARRRLTGGQGREFACVVRSTPNPSPKHASTRQGSVDMNNPTNTQAAQRDRASTARCQIRMPDDSTMTFRTDRIPFPHTRHGRRHGPYVFSTGPVDHAYGTSYFAAIFDPETKRCVTVQGPAANGATAESMAITWIKRAEAQNGTKTLRAKQPEASPAEAPMRTASEGVEHHG